MSEISTKNFPERHGATWSKEEFQQLILAIEQDLTLSELAERHQRTSGGILGAIKRLLPSEFCQNNNIGSVSDLARYFNDTQNQERACLINALCPSAATEKKTEKNQETGASKQTASSCAAVPGVSGKTPDEKQITGFVPSTEFLDYVASESDVIMLISAAVDNLSKERDRDILLMRLGTDEHPYRGPLGKRKLSYAKTNRRLYDEILLILERGMLFYDLMIHALVCKHKSILKRKRYLPLRH